MCINMLKIQFYIICISAFAYPTILKLLPTMSSIWGSKFKEDGDRQQSTTQAWICKH